MKKFAGDIILHKCTKNHNHMMYSSWDTDWDKTFFAILDNFLPFYPSDTKKTTEFYKNEKNAWRYHHFKIVH